MKIRIGFVSNSSSESFCIYGAYFCRDEFIPVLNKLRLPYEVDTSEEDWIYNNVDLYDVAIAIREQMGPEWSFFFSREEAGDFYLGMKFDQLGDDETGKEFKDRIKAKLTELAEYEVEVEIISETVY